MDQRALNVLLVYILQFCHRLDRVIVWMAGSEMFVQYMLEIETPFAKAATDQGQIIAKRESATR